MRKKTEIVINKHTISWTNALVKIKFQEAFSTMLKAQVNPSSLFDIVKHLSFADSTPQKAFVLIKKSILGACMDLIIESNSAKGVLIDGENLSVLGKKMNNFFDSKIEAEFTLGPELIKNPRSLPIIDEAKNVFFECLKELEFNDEERSSLSNRLKTYTVFNLHEEWRQYSVYYAQVKSGLFSEYSDAFEKEIQWDRYYDFLKKETEKSVFGESFSLADIYIQLRAYYQTRTSDAPNKKIVVDLTRHLDSWLESANANDTIRVISGGPGSGKSSFSKIYASYCAEKGAIRVLHIPMHYLTLKDDITDLVGRFAKERGLKENPFELNEKVLVIFDGLDELSMQGRLAEEIARNFIDLVTKEINLKNTRSGPKLFVLITGRDLVVQSGETYLRKEGQILYLLPYLAYLAKEFDDPEELLGVDQRNLWWKKFGKLKGYGYSGLPQELQSPSLEEITTQPLLNYLVALSYTRKTYDFTGSISLNEIYANLIESVYNRGYEESGRTTAIHRSLENRDGYLTLPEFEKVLGEIAIATWQGNGRTTTVNAIEQRFQNPDLKQILESFQRNAESGVTNLLTAFYFRKSEEISGTEKTFEFTHKSFSEYLTARRIVKIFVNSIHEELERKKQDSDRGIDISEALEKWAKLTGKAKMDTYIRDFLLREMKLWSKKPEINMDSLQNTLIEMINQVVKNNFPLEKIAGLTFRQSVSYFQNAAEALFVLHFSVVSITKKLSRIKWGGFSSAGNLLNLTAPQREKSVRRGGLLPDEQQMPDNLKNIVPKGLAFQNLAYIDFYDQNLSCADFAAADLSYSKFTECGLTYGVFIDATLIGARISKSTSVEGANFSRANLSGAGLYDISLKDVNFNHANLTDARISTNISGASFRYANFTGARLADEGELKNVDLSYADMRGAEFEGVEWGNTLFEGTKFLQKDLTPELEVMLRERGAEIYSEDGERLE